MDTLSESYRPKTLDEVIGQVIAKQKIESLVCSGERRCLLFSGPSGTGKTTLARIVARAIQGPDFPAGYEPDVLEINAASMRGITEIKGLVDATMTYPMVGEYRVIILDEAHRITEPAQILLLKPFEDAVSKNLWIICTTEPDQLIQTLRNRCTKIPLSPLSPEERVELIERGRLGLFPPDENLKGEGIEVFIEQVQKKGLDIPRNILTALQDWHDGVSAEEAVTAELPQQHAADLKKRKK